MYDLTSEFQITPLFHYIRDKSREAGLYPYYANRKQVIELFINHELLEDRSIRIGIIQYEGSNTPQKEPDLVNWRFERQALTTQLLQELESITSISKDTLGPQNNPKTQSISFKFEQLNDSSKATIQQIVDVLLQYT